MDTPTKGALMISTCVNPECIEELNVFGASALYALEKSATIDVPRHTEYFWLCASCVARFTVQTDAAGNVIVVPGSEAPASRRFTSAGHPRLVFRSTSVPLPIAGSIWKQDLHLNALELRRLAEPAKLRLSNPSETCRKAAIQQNG